MRKKYYFRFKYLNQALGLNTPLLPIDKVQEYEKDVIPEYLKKCEYIELYICGNNKPIKTYKL